MKRLLTIIIILIISFTKVYAISYELVCPNISSTSKEIEVSVYVNKSSNDDKISAIEGVLSYDTKILKLSKYNISLKDWTTLSSDDRFAFGNITFNNLLSNNKNYAFSVTFNVIGEINNGTKLAIINPVFTDSNGDNFSSVSGGNCTISLLSSNNNLKSITLSEGKINFNPNTTEYNIEVNTNKINIKTELDSNKASYINWDNSKTVNLKYGKNVIKIVVKAENGSTKTYKLNISRSDTRDTNNSLKDLKISSGTIEFSPDVLSYKVNVDSSVDSIIFTPELASSKSKYEIVGPDNLQEGTNIYRIVVTSENDSEKTYMVIVVKEKRQEIEETPIEEDKAILNNIEIEGYNISFNSDNTEYEIDSNDTSFKLKIDANEDVNYKIENDGKVNEDGKIIVRVTDKQGNEKSYVIKVNALEEESSSDSIVNYLPIIIPVSIGLIILIVFLISAKSKKAKLDNQTK